MSWDPNGEYLPTTSSEGDIPSGDEYLYHAMPRADFVNVMTEGGSDRLSGVISGIFFTHTLIMLRRLRV